MPGSTVVEPRFSPLARRACELFLGGLPGQVTQGQLRRYVEEGSGITPLEVTPLRNDRGDVEAAVVLFRTVDEAERALAALPARPLLGRTVRVSKRPPPGQAPPRPAPPAGRQGAHVYIGNVPNNACEVDLEDHIAPVAPVWKVVMHSGNGRSSAHVWLKDPEDADAVIACLDGSVLLGRALRVQRPHRSDER